MVQAVSTRMNNCTTERFTNEDGFVVTNIHTSESESFSITDYKNGRGQLFYQDYDSTIEVFYIVSYSDYEELAESIKLYDNITDYERFRILLALDKIVKGGC